jgi:hypothetical protein
MRPFIFVFLLLNSPVFSSVRNLVYASADSLRLFERAFSRLIERRGEYSDSTLSSFLQDIRYGRAKKLSLNEVQELQEPLNEVRKAYDDLYQATINNIEVLNEIPIGPETGNKLPELWLLESRIAFLLGSNDITMGSLDLEKKVKRTRRIVKEFHECYDRAGIGTGTPGITDEKDAYYKRGKVDCVGLDRFISLINKQRRSNLLHDGNSTDLANLLWEHNNLAQVQYHYLNEIYGSPFGLLCVSPEKHTEAFFKEAHSFLVDLMTDEEVKRKVRHNVNDLHDSVVLTDGVEKLVQLANSQYIKSLIDLTILKKHESRLQICTEKAINILNQWIKKRRDLEVNPIYCDGYPVCSDQDMQKIDEYIRISGAIYNLLEDYDKILSSSK